MAMEIFKLVGSVFVDTDAADKSLQKTDKNAENFGKTLLNGIGTAAKWAAGIAAAAGTAATALAIASVDSYADYEQLVGGVETLFGDSADAVLKYAENAYKTAGLTANEYMETVTSFSASLLQGLNGDTAEAAKIADMAITDMSDNANKMGSSMESIQNAYQGFAKQNYTMLDNLKLGYGGTKTEMERLLEDANKINAEQGIITEYSIDNLNDVYEAIHVVQEKMGITGTTATEATSTISGGIGMIKAQLENFKTTIGAALAPVVKELITTVINNLPTIQGWVDQLAPILSEMVSGLIDSIPGIIEGIEGVVQFGGDLLSWAEDIGGYIGDTLSPIFEDLADGLTFVAEQLEPVITALSDYVTSGEAAEDITNAIKGAVDLLADGYQGLKDFVAGIVQGFQDMVTWGQQNETLLTLIAIAVGTLTTAIIAYNAAQAIKNAGGIVELAQLAATAVGLAGLTVAETAHTVATTIATAATTAFGAVMAFITSPITLVVLAIGALIAIIVLLVKNWDTVKEWAIKCWEGIKSAWDKVASWFDTNVTKPIADFFSGLWNGIKTTFAPVGEWFSNLFANGAKGVMDAWSGIGKWFSSLLDGVQSVFSDVATAVGGIFKSPINTIIRGINSFISGINQIQIPDWVPAVGGKGFNIPKIPELEEGTVLERGQVGLLEGNGAEAVVPLHKNKKWISAVAQDMDSAIGGGSSDQVVAVLMDILTTMEEIAQMGITLDTGALVGGLAKPMDKKLGQIQAQKARA